MKQLSIEEKAKAYDKAKSIMEKYLKSGNAGVIAENTIKKAFPELKESEDERIRKELLEHCKNQAKPYIQTGNKCPQIQSWIDWLEKQGKDKVSVVDFKAKDWYVSKVDGKIYNAKFMESSTNQTRKLEIEKAAMSATGIIEQEGWFIKGAEWADENPSYISSEKQGDTNETINRDEFAQGVLRGAAINLITWIDYNAAEGNMCLSNMECKDIEDALVNGDWDKIHAYIKKKLEKQGEQKPTEYTLEQAAGIFLDALSNTPYNNKPITDAQVITKELLKFLSDAYSYNPNAINEQKPDDNKGMSIDEESMTPFQKKVFCIIDTAIEEEQGLKQVCDELLVLASDEIKQKPAWSEEDSTKMQRIIDFLWYNRKGDTDTIYQQEKDIEWLKSLKDRYAWKPSEEQMHYLYWIANIKLGDSVVEQEVSKHLNELYEDLKKLKG